MGHTSSNTWSTGTSPLSHGPHLLQVRQDVILIHYNQKLLRMAGVSGLVRVRFPPEPFLAETAYKNNFCLAFQFSLFILWLELRCHTFSIHKKIFKHDHFYQYWYGCTLVIVKGCGRYCYGAILQKGFKKCLYKPSANYLISFFGENYVSNNCLQPS